MLPNAMQGDPMNSIPGTRWLDYDIRDLTMSKVLAKQVRERPDKAYIRTTAGLAMTYRETDLATNRIVNWLHAHGADADTHVAVMMDNSSDSLLVMIALAKAGIVTVPINVNARGPQLAHYLNLSDVSWIIAESAFTSQIAEVASDVPKLDTVILANGQNQIPGIRQQLDLADWSTAPDTPFDNASLHSDLAFILFTSGTTGLSKGVMFNQSRTFLWDEGVVSDLDVGGHDTYFAVTPLSHASGLFSGAFMMMAVGGTIAIPPRFSASRFWNDARATGATFTTLLGAMVSFLESVPPSPADSDNPMRLISAGPYPATWQSFEERFGLKLVSGYGLSDHSSCTKLPIDAPADKRGSAGKPIASYEMLIVDEEDMPVAPGVVGECLLRGRYPWRASMGYYKQPEAVLEARRNEWFHTGDSGYLDADGYFWYVGRKKDAIRRRGENISAFEVEQFVAMHPEVDQVAAYPLSAELSEDEVAVSVVAKSAGFAPATLIRFCMEKMPDYMVPRFVHLVDELPRNLNQRIEKFKLIQWCNENRAGVWDRENDPELCRRAKAPTHTVS